MITGAGAVADLSSSIISTVAPTTAASMIGSFKNDDVVDLKDQIVTLQKKVILSIIC